MSITKWLKPGITGLSLTLILAQSTLAQNELTPATNLRGLSDSSLNNAVPATPKSVQSLPLSASGVRGKTLAALKYPWRKAWAGTKKSAHVINVSALWLGRKVAPYQPLLDAAGSIGGIATPFFVASKYH